MNGSWGSEQFPPWLGIIINLAGDWYSVLVGNFQFLGSDVLFVHWCGGDKTLILIEACAKDIPNP